MTITDVIREQRPLGRRPRLNQKDPLEALGDRHDEALVVQHEQVAVAENRSARQRRPELDAVVSRTQRMRARALFPAERHLCHARTPAPRPADRAPGTRAR
jgi:hypothetical protein